MGNIERAEPASMSLLHLERVRQSNVAPHLSAIRARLCSSLGFRRDFSTVWCWRGVALATALMFSFWKSGSIPRIHFVRNSYSWARTWLQTGLRRREVAGGWVVVRFKDWSARLGVDSRPNAVPPCLASASEVNRDPIPLRILAESKARTSFFIVGTRRITSHLPNSVCLNEEPDLGDSSRHAELSSSFIMLFSPETTQETLDHGALWLSEA